MARVQLRDIRDKGGAASIGIGTWALGGATGKNTSYGDMPEAHARATLEAGIEAGSRFIDTANAYGMGRGEKIIAEVMADPAIRAACYVTTKVGMGLDFAPIWNQGIDQIRQSLEDSLTRLKMDRIDLVQLHSPPADIMTTLPALPELLLSWQKQGVIGDIGVSAKTPMDGLHLLKVFPFDSVQVNFNMLDGRAKQCGLFDHCAANDIPVILRTPLCFGYLTLQLDENTKLAEGDHRSTWPAAQRAAWAVGARRVQAIAERLDDRDPPANINVPVWRALRYCLSWPSAAVTIPGPMSPEEARENVLAGIAGPLPQAALDAIIRENEEHDIFVEANRPKKG